MRLPFLILYIGNPDLKTDRFRERRQKFDYILTSLYVRAREALAQSCERLFAAR